MARKLLDIRTVAVLMLLIGAVSYGLLSTFIKLAYDQWSLAEVTSSQVLLGTIMLWIIVLIRPQQWTNPFKGPWIQLSLIGVFGLFLTTMFFNVSLSYMDASISIVLLFQFTWITILFDSVAKRTWPTLWQLFCVGLILIGTFCAVNVFEVNYDTLSPLGVMLGLASAVTYASFIFFTGRVQTTMDPVMRSAVMWTAAIPVVFMVWPPMTFDTSGIYELVGWGILLGLLGQVIPTITFNIGIPKVGSSMAALIGSSELPAAVVVAYLILD